MRRRAATGSKAAKGAPRKRAKRRIGKSGSRSPRTTANLAKRVEDLARELAEAREQQTAAGEVLRAISSSPGDLEPVFQAMLDNATRICGAEFGVLFKFANGAVEPVASHNSPEALDRYLRERGPIKPRPGSTMERAMLSHEVSHVADVRKDRDAANNPAAKYGAARTLLTVPMLKDKEIVGFFNIYRQEVRPFTERQVELVQNFAAQAVIAITNARLFNEIQETSRQLAEASRHKSQFLANMSHELRTPLNAIMGYTELIIDNVYGDVPEKARAVLRRVESNGKHLLGLINDVLDFSKIEAGQLKLALADYSMRDVVYNVASAVEPLAAKKNLGFKVDVLRDVPAAQGDERRLTQVLLNLVGNAIKFTDVGSVAIKVAANGGVLSVAVHDTGPGIAPGDHEKLFEEFQQADNSITKTKGGTGLGLAISRRIIELHGGRLWVDSRPGDGSVFTFTVPAVVTQQPERPL